VRIGLVGCVKSKQDRPAPSKDLYPYGDMGVVRHGEAVGGPGARRGLAVRLREDGVAGWARHAVLRLGG
jgi:hypothetical protein